MAPWLSRLKRQPVTLETAGSNPAGVANYGNGSPPSLAAKGSVLKNFTKQSLGFDLVVHLKQGIQAA